MALSFLLVLAATVILIRPETPVTKVDDGCYSAKEPMCVLCAGHADFVNLRMLLCL